MLRSGIPPPPLTRCDLHLLEVPCRHGVSEIPLDLHRPLAAMIAAVNGAQEQVGHGFTAVIVLALPHEEERLLGGPTLD